MSKSLGNVVEPEEPLKKYSADTLRQWAANGTLGDDYPFSWEECDHSERFLTKLWNISRFIQMHLEDFKEGRTPQFREIDLWILSLLQELIADTSGNMDNYVFNIPMERTRSFMWHELADNYLEMVKHRLYKPEVYGEESRYAAQYTLNTILKNILKLLAPYTPHICEELWDNIYSKEYVTVSKWPTPDKKLISEEAKEAGELAKRLVGEVRRYKSENGIPLAKEIEKVKIYINKDLASRIEKIREDIKATGKINKLDVEVSDIKEFAVEITC
ncbi:MAG: class I tRNA ligase family protein, partial [Candidatus Altiarchaeales archaeon]|nr:class I tRNA ligase family protein [Candidatus Altiarchaeales archaeon]